MIKRMTFVTSVALSVAFISPAFAGIQTKDVEILKVKKTSFKHADNTINHETSKKVGTGVGAAVGGAAAGYGASQLGGGALTGLASVGGAKLGGLFGSKAGGQIQKKEVTVEAVVLTVKDGGNLREIFQVGHKCEYKKGHASLITGKDGKARIQPNSAC